jgi:hypothetical protein
MVGSNIKYSGWNKQPRCKLCGKWIYKGKYGYTHNYLLLCPEHKKEYKNSSRRVNKHEQ